MGVHINFRGLMVGHGQVAMSSAAPKKKDRRCVSLRVAERHTSLRVAHCPNSNNDLSGFAAVLAQDARGESVLTALAVDLPSVRP